LFAKDRVKRKRPPVPPFVRRNTTIRQRGPTLTKAHFRLRDGPCAGAPVVIRSRSEFEGSAARIKSGVTQSERLFRGTARDNGTVFQTPVGWRDVSPPITVNSAVVNAGPHQARVLSRSKLRFQFPLGLPTLFLKTRNGPQLAAILRENRPPSKSRPNRRPETKSNGFEENDCLAQSAHPNVRSHLEKASTNAGSG